MEEPGAFLRLGRWIDRHLLAMITIGTAVGFALLVELGKVAIDDEAAMAWRIGSALLILITLAGALISFRWQQDLNSKNSELNEENANLRHLISRFGNDIPSLWENKLKTIASELGFDGADRISIYRYEEGEFSMVGRYSERPELNQLGRALYPVGQGVIGAAWSSPDGCSFVNDLPDPATDLAGYRTRNRLDWNIPNAVSEGFKMKSRTVAAFCLKADGERRAIAVVESCTPNRFELDHLRGVFHGPVGKEVLHLMSVTKDKLPSLQFAHDKGF